MINVKTISGHPLIIASVTDFCDSMGYCEFKVKHFLRGIKPPQTDITIEGTQSHEKEAKFEKEHFKFVPLSKDELEDSCKDVEFPFEDLYTRFFTTISYAEAKIPFLIFGQADKIRRSKGTLIVEDSKYPSNKEKYFGIVEPFDNQKLQALLYLNSTFSRDGSLDPNKCWHIPHTEKAWIVNIKDKQTQENIKTFKGIQTKEAEDFLEKKIKRFGLIVLGKVEPKHHLNARKCQSCRFNDCENKLG